MSRNTKIILGIVAGLVALCLCVGIGGFLVVGAIGRNVVSSTATDPEQAAKVARDIVDYQLPPGWQEQYATHILGISLAGISNSSGDGFAMLMQFPSSMAGDPAAMQRQVEQAIKRQIPGAPSDMAEVGQQQATIRGQRVNFTISEGAGDNGATYRAMTGTFPGKSGTVLLTIVGPKDSWNESEINQFIASLR